MCFIFDIPIVILDNFMTQGPYLGTTRTHLQRELVDDNILIVKFAVESMSITNRITGSTDKDSAFNMIAKEGILVGLRHYRFFGDISFYDLNMKHFKSSLLFLYASQNYWVRQRFKVGIH